MKVVDILTKDDRDQPAFDLEQAERLIAHMLKLHAPDSMDMAFSERWMMDQVMDFIENNSGADRIKVLTQLERKGA